MPRTKLSNALLNKTQFLHVPFTPNPKRKLRFLSQDSSEQEAGVAVAEAEILARILEDKHCPPEIQNSIRALMVGACLWTAKALDTHHVEPELVRDIYPYGRAIMGKQLRELFESLLVDLKRTAPGIFDSFFDPQQKKKPAKGKKKMILKAL